MKFAACGLDGRLTNSEDLSEGCTGTCAACGGGVWVCDSRWMHRDEEMGLSCPIGCRDYAEKPTERTKIITSPYFDKKDSPKGPTLIKYSPEFFGGVTSLYMKAESAPLPDGFVAATWCPHAMEVCIGDEEESEPLRVNILKKTDPGADANAQKVERIVPARGPKGELSRAALQKFHRTALLHIDPLHSGLPPWRSIRAPPGGGKTTLLMDIARAWPKCNFMIVTFARDIACELRTRAQNHPGGPIRNLTVKTLDALSYASEFGSAGAQCEERCGDSSIAKLDSRSIVESSYPRCKPWNKKKGSSGIGPIMEHVLRSIPLSHSVDDVSPFLCEKHSQFDWILKALCAPAPPRQGTFTGSRFARLRTSFASMRARSCRSKDSLDRMRAAVADTDVLLIDEAQDMTPQSLQILKTLSIPTIAVGDPRQCVYGYVDSRVCADCVRLTESAVQSSCYNTDGFAGASLSLTLDLYETHRLDPFTCRLVDEWTNGRLGMVSTRETLTEPSVYFVDRVPPHPHPLLLLVRSNRELVDAALSDASFGIVGGSALATDLRYNKPAKISKKNARGRDRLSAIESMALDLCEKGTLDEVCDMLTNRDAPLADAHGGRVMSSIHRCKGAEAPHVAMFNTEITTASDESEFCIMVVAMTRHTERLSIVRNCCTKESKGVKRKRP